MKNEGFGHLKTRICTKKTSKNVGFGGPWYNDIRTLKQHHLYIMVYLTAGKFT